MSIKKIRIIVILPFYGGSLPIGEYCISALKELGHCVEVFDAPLFFGSVEAFRSLRIRNSRYEEIESTFLQVIAQAIYAKVEEFEPDLVLSLAQAPVTKQLLKRLKKDKVTTAMWFVEDYTVFPYWRSFAPYYDFFFVIQKDPFLEELKNIGVLHSLYLPMAALPSFHKPLDLSNIDQVTYGANLAFLGAGYPNRRAAFRQLMGFQFKIWGSDWDGAAMLDQYIQAKGRRILPEEAVKIFNATKININLHSSIKASQLVSHGDFVNPRTFEVAACNAFQLVDKRQLLCELFTDKEMVTFESIEELKEQISYYLEHLEKCISFSEQARKRVLEEHTYQHRMMLLLQYVAENTTNFPKEHKKIVFPKDIPLEIQAKLEALFTRLRLPMDSSFEDIIIRLRQESGVLSELETALLFLDEWKKAYTK